MVERFMMAAFIGGIPPVGREQVVDLDNESGSLRHFHLESCAIIEITDDRAVVPAFPHRLLENDVAAFDIPLAIG